MKRIGDNEFARFGERSITFQNTYNEKPYYVDVNDRNQDDLVVRVENSVLNIDLQRKFQRDDGVFVLMGMLRDREGKLIDGGAAWCELVLDRPASLIFWGTGVVIRTDVEIS